MKKVLILGLLVYFLVCLSAPYVFGQPKEILAKNIKDSILVSEKFNFSIQKLKGWEWKDILIAKYIVAIKLGVETDGIAICKENPDYESRFAILAYIEPDITMQFFPHDSAADSLKKVLKEAGCTDIKTKDVIVDGVRTVSVKAECKLSKEQSNSEKDLTLYIEQMTFYHRGVEYAISISAEKSEFLKVKNDFQKIKDSFNFPKK